MFAWIFLLLIYSQFNFYLVICIDFFFSFESSSAAFTIRKPLSLQRFDEYTLLFSNAILWLFISYISLNSLEPSYCVILFPSSKPIVLIIYVKNNLCHSFVFDAS